MSIVSKTSKKNVFLFSFFDIAILSNNTINYNPTIHSNYRPAERNGL
ncbi:MAG: hypothetical protein ACTSRO_11795 [Candidatus Heimdallarchaeaceae archaeon]